MSVARRRGKTAWIKQLRRCGYTYRGGLVWERWRWQASLGLGQRDLPIWSGDYEGRPVPTGRGKGARTC